MFQKFIHVCFVSFLEKSSSTHVYPENEYLLEKNEND